MTHITGNRGRTSPLPVFLFFVFCFFSPCSADQPLVVLVYHHIEEKPTSEVSCTPQGFSEQMEALLRNGFSPLNPEKARLFLAGAISVGKPVLITFDDGYESLYHHALPVALALKIPMTVFVITSRIGLKPQFTQYLSEAQISEMASSGYFDFGSHTHDLHFDILRLFDAFQTTPNPVLRLLDDDLRLSKARLENIISRSVYALAWPYGKFNPKTTRLARQHGFLLHFTSRSGFNEPGTNPFGIKRIPVTSRDTPASVLRKAGN